MDRKRELTSVDLAALVGELGEYAGAKVDKAYLYEDDLLRLKMRDFDRGRVELLVEVGDVKRAHVAAPEHVPDAPGRPPNFAMMLRNRLQGADFAGVEQFEFDRILQFHFERTDADTTVVAELFGDGNVAVLDEHGEVVDCLETVRLKSRTVAPGAPYEFPSSRYDPLTADYEAFAARMNDSDTDVVRTLATQLNFGGLYGEELCTRAGVEKTKPIDEATESDYEAIYAVIDDLAGRLRSGDLDPRIYYETDDGDDRAGDGDGSDGSDSDESDGGGSRTRVDVTPLPLEEYGHLDSAAHESFDAALDEYFFEFEREEGGDGGGGRQRPDFEAEIEKKERIIAQQESAIEDFEADAERERRKAELLYANYDLVDDVVSTVRAAREDGHGWDDIEARFEEGKERGIAAAEAVVDVDGREHAVTVELDGERIAVDVQEGVEVNADRLYQEAKRIEDKKAGAEAAVEDTREELREVKRRREQWDADDDGEEDDEEDEDETEDVDWLAEPSIPIRESDSWYERFRWFHTSDGFLVVGGRNADQNEGLVKKYLDKGDLFFHAQAHGGPVTILKGTDPSEPAPDDLTIPESSKREAAQFAVSYSSVWKEGKFAGDAYAVEPDQVSKTPESGEFLEKGGFAIRGDRTYFRDVDVGVAVGVACEPETRVLGGPPSAVVDRVETHVELEPGRYAQNDVAKRVYRELKGRFADETFVRKVASPDLIQEFLPPGGSRMVEE